MQSEEASTSAAPPSEVAVPDDIDSPSAGAPLGADRKLRERTPKAYKGADEPAPDEEELEAKKAKAAKRKAEDDALAAKARRKRAAGQKLRPIEPLAAPENLKTWRSWLESLPDDTTLERALGQPVPSAVPPSLRLHTPEALIGHLLHVHQFLHAFGPQLGQSTDPHDPLGLAGLGLREIDAAVVHGDLGDAHAARHAAPPARQVRDPPPRAARLDTEKDAYHDFLASAETDDGVDDFLHLDAPTARAVLDTLAATHHAWPQLAYVCVRALCGAHRRSAACPPAPPAPAAARARPPPPARPPPAPPTPHPRHVAGNPGPARARGDAAGAALGEYHASTSPRATSYSRCFAISCWRRRRRGGCSTTARRASKRLNGIGRRRRRWGWRSCSR